MSIHVAAPHSALVVRAVQPVPLTPGPAAFAGAESERPEVGRGSGALDRFGFVASQPGSYRLASGVPGHATAGMFLRLVVSAEAAAPSFR